MYLVLKETSYTLHTYILFSCLCTWFCDQITSMAFQQTSRLSHLVCKSKNQTTYIQKTMQLIKAAAIALETFCTLLAPAVRGEKSFALGLKIQGMLRTQASESSLDFQSERKQAFSETNILLFLEPITSKPTDTRTSKNDAIFS